MPIPKIQSQSSNEATTVNSPRSTTTTAKEIKNGAGAGGNTGAGLTREKTAAELEADQVYEEAMEEEYAKREGGA